MIMIHDTLQKPAHGERSGQLTGRTVNLVRAVPSVGLMLLPVHHVRVEPKLAVIKLGVHGEYDIISKVRHLTL
jgi:hypothetical protein